MKNTMGRLAGAVSVCALITLTVASAATAQTTEPTPTSEVTTSPTSPPTTVPTSTPTATSTTRPEDPHVDGDVIFAYIGHSQGMLWIVCAAGKPQNLVSPDIDVSGGLYPETADHHWGMTFFLPSGIPIDDIRLSFTCGGKRYGDVPVPVPGGTVTPGNDTGKAQVKQVPKGGVETGFGGTADIG
ncbi:hypothetical protein [Amycolatopsis sp.]|uniref:hypothetical protein n=1 Tax=Amycolatopsis sp. TaxID=37632 RepID=UPI002E087CAF|nr:hypothetical protein [Amycolatopsis sp.]